MTKLANNIYTTEDCLHFAISGRKKKWYKKNDFIITPTIKEHAFKDLILDRLIS